MIRSGRYERREREGNGTMDDREEKLHRLSAMLEAMGPGTDAMSVAEMDGFVTALAVFPERTEASEWLPHVLGSATRIDSAEETAAVEAALIGHFDGVACALAQEPGNYGPVLEVDEDTDQLFWQAWVFGFARAVRLRPEAWARIEGSGETAVQESVKVIEALYAAANGTSALAAEALGLLDSMAPAMIGGIVRDLNASGVCGRAAVSATETGPEVATGTADEAGEATAVALMGKLRRHLLDRLETGEDHRDRHMVALIDALQGLQMHPGDALHAVVGILTAIGPDTTRNELMRLAAGITEMRRQEKREAGALGGSAGMH